MKLIGLNFELKVRKVFPTVSKTRKLDKTYPEILPIFGKHLYSIFFMLVHVFLKQNLNSKISKLAPGQVMSNTVKIKLVHIKIVQKEIPVFKK